MYTSNFFFFFSSRRRHTRLQGDWSSDVCSSDLLAGVRDAGNGEEEPVAEAAVSAAPARIGARGFEPPTPCAQGRCATGLRYAPVLTGASATLTVELASVNPTAHATA